MKRPPVLLLLAAGLILFLYAYRLGARAFWEPDETRYAEIGREMLVTGDWTTPRLNSVKYYEKPPLTYWVVAASFGALGVSEGTARLGPVIAALLLLGATWVTGRAFLGARSAALGAAMLALSPLCWASGRLLVTDMFLTAGIWWGFAGYALAVRARERGASVLPAMALAGAGLAASLLAKGPIAIVLFLFGILPARLLAGRAAAVGAVGWGVAASVAAALAAPWFLTISLRDPAFAWFFFVHEHVLRYATPVSRREESWYYYLLILLAGLFPTSTLIPWSIRRVWPAWRPRALLDRGKGPAPGPDRESVRAGKTAPEGARPSPKGAREAVGVAVLLSTALITLAFFTVSRSKLASYILPATPAFCLIVGHALARVMGRDAGSARRLASTGDGPAGGRVPRGLRTSLALGAAVSAMGAAGINLIVLPQYLTSEITRWTPRLTVLLAALGIALGAAAASGSVRALRLGAAVAGASLLALLLAVAHVSEQLDRYKSVKEAAHWVSEEARPGDLVGSYGTLLQGLTFYTGRRTVVIGGRGELTFGVSIEPGTEVWFPTKRELLNVITGRRAYIVVSYKDVMEALELSEGRLRVVRDGPRFSVLSNVP